MLNLGLEYFNTLFDSFAGLKLKTFDSAQLARVGQPVMFQKLLGVHSAHLTAEKFQARLAKMFLFDFLLCEQ